VKTDNRGRIEVDDHFNTSVKVPRCNWPPARQDSVTDASRHRGPTSPFNERFVWLSTEVRSMLALCRACTPLAM
jgi:hypothetical protein